MIRIYLRVSTDQQDERTQMDHIERFLMNTGQGSVPRKVYKDKKTSKKTLIKRSGGAELFRDLQPGDTIVAMRLDRLARSLTETALLTDAMDIKNVEIILVEQPGIKNKIMLGLYAGMAEEEVKLLRKRISEKLSSKKQRGERYSKILPYGYALHETKLVPVKQGHKILMKRGVLIPVHEEQQILKIMQALHSDGYSYAQICRHLEDLGHKNREGKPFQKMTIFRILRRTHK